MNEMRFDGILSDGSESVTLQNLRRAVITAPDTGIYVEALVSKHGNPYFKIYVNKGICSALPGDYTLIAIIKAGKILKVGSQK